MQERPQLLVLAPEQLKEDGDDDSGLDDVLSPHDFKAGDESHADFGVNDTVVLL